MIENVSDEDLGETLSKLWVTELDGSTRPATAIAAPWLGEDCYVDPLGRMYGVAEALRNAREDYIAGRLKQSALATATTFGGVWAARDALIARIKRWERDTGISWLPALWR